MPNEEVVQDPVNNDVVATPQNPDGVDEPAVANEEMPQEEFQDTNYIQEPTVMGSDIELSVAEEQRTLKLYEIFNDLNEYIEIYYDSFKTIQFDTLEMKQYQELSYLIKNLFKLKEECEYYLNELYVEESYEKNLYTYILMRTNFIEIIKKVRIVLKLRDTNKENETSEGRNND